MRLSLEPIAFNPQHSRNPVLPVSSFPGLRNETRGPRVSELELPQPWPHDRGYLGRLFVCCEVSGIG